MPSSLSVSHTQIVAFASEIPSLVKGFHPYYRNSTILCMTLAKYVLLVFQGCALVFAQ